MTLCIAWRDQNGNVCLASDSRITIGGNSYEDVAVKVTRIPCEIFPPDSTLTTGSGVTRIPIGMAFAGSHLGAYVIKESLIEVLSRLQHIPNATIISMDKICKIAFYAYETLSKRICSTVIAEKGICEILLAGYCHQERQVRAFKLSTDKKTNTHSLSEILLPDTPEIELSGSGKNAASLQKNLKNSPLRALRDVINDTSRPDVGGSYQFGVCSPDDFKIFAEYKIDESGWPAYMRAGLNIQSIICSGEHDDLFISPLIYDLGEPE